MSIRGIALLTGGSGLMAYILMSVFRSDEKKIKELQSWNKNVGSSKVTHSNIIDLAATSSKPLYKLNKKELDELIRAESNKK